MCGYIITRTISNIVKGNIATYLLDHLNLIFLKPLCCPSSQEGQEDQGYQTFQESQEILQVLFDQVPPLFLADHQDLSILGFQVFLEGLDSLFHLLFQYPPFDLSHQACLKFQVDPAFPKDQVILLFHPSLVVQVVHLVQLVLGDLYLLCYLLFRSGLVNQDLL